MAYEIFTISYAIWFYFPIFLIYFSNWIIGRFKSANPYTIINCTMDSVCTLKIPWSGGIIRTPVMSSQPRINAPIRYLLLQNLFVKITGLFALQLNPCTRRLLQSVPNAMVLASNAFPLRYPIKKAVIVIIPMHRPSTPMLVRNCFVKMDSFTVRGLSFMTSGL